MGEMMRTFIGVDVGGLTIQSTIHAAVNLSESEPTTIPTKYFGDVVMKMELPSLLRTQEGDTSSYLVYRSTVSRNATIRGGMESLINRSSKTAFRSISGKIPFPGGHRDMVESKRHKASTTGYNDDGCESMDAIDVR